MIRPLLICLFALLLFNGEIVYCQDDLLVMIEKRQKELDEKERSLRLEEERLQAMKKDLDEKLKRYSDLLKKINSILDQMEQKNIQNMEYLVKVYESMPPEEAGQRLGALDETLAATILKKMRPRKAGAILSTMEPQKVSAITRHLSQNKKKIPER